MNGGSIRVEIDAERCMGSGNCVYVVPQVFDLDDRGVAIVIGDPAEYRDRVQHAADTCPTSAITVIED